jgi:hypothetical protein
VFIAIGITAAPIATIRGCTSEVVSHDSNAPRAAPDAILANDPDAVAASHSSNLFMFCPDRVGLCGCLGGHVNTSGRVRSVLGSLLYLRHR